MRTPLPAVGSALFHFCEVAWPAAIKAIGHTLKAAASAQGANVAYTGGGPAISPFAYNCCRRYPCLPGPGRQRADGCHLHRVDAPSECGPLPKWMLSCHGLQRRLSMLLRNNDIGIAHKGLQAWCLFRSVAALTYAEAQSRIDDERLQDLLSTNLRRLNQVQCSRGAAALLESTPVPCWKAILLVVFSAESVCYQEVFAQQRRG